MVKYLPLFPSHSEYEQAKSGLEKPNVSMCQQENEVHYNANHDYSKDYLTFEALEDNVSIYARDAIRSVDLVFSASTNNGASWTEYTSTRTLPGTLIATLNQGDKLLIKGDTFGTSVGAGSCGFDSNGGEHIVYGNVMSLVHSDNFIGKTAMTKTYIDEWEEEDPETGEIVPMSEEVTNNLCFAGMFQTNEGLVSAENLILPSTTLVENCYEYMFNSCTGLTTAPTLPATTLASNCYNDMFRNCTSLTTAPVLSATTLADWCYEGMFKDCTSLNSITCLATDISASGCLTNWVDGVASTGTFTKAASMTSWTTSTSGIPDGWTVQNA